MKTYHHFGNLYDNFLDFKIENRLGFHEMYTREKFYNVYEMFKLKGDNLYESVFWYQKIFDIKENQFVKNIKIKHIKEIYNNLGIKIFANLFSGSYLEKYVEFVIYKIEIFENEYYYCHLEKISPFKDDIIKYPPTINIVGFDKFSAEKPKWAPKLNKFFNRCKKTKCKNSEIEKFDDFEYVRGFTLRSIDHLRIDLICKIEENEIYNYKERHQSHCFVSIYKIKINKNL